MDKKIKVLNESQNNKKLHPFTCPSKCKNRNLIATNDGWICKCGKYKQSYDDELDDSYINLLESLNNNK